jgi:hypothetical protein
MPPSGRGGPERPIPQHIADKVVELVWSAPPGTLFVHGGAREGIDRIASVAIQRRILSERDVQEHVLRPEYNRYPHRFAPLKRNSDIVALIHVLHCWRVAMSKGTTDALEKAKAAGKEWCVVDYDADGNEVDASCSPGAFPWIGPLPHAITEETMEEAVRGRGEAPERRTAP